METKKYVNKNGNVIVIKQDTTGFSPMYENQTTLNYFTWEKDISSLQETYVDTLPEWFENATHYQYKFDKLAKEAIENGISTDSLEFYEILCKKLSESKIFALPIMKVKNAVYPYVIAASPSTLEGNMVGIAWETEDFLAQFGLLGNKKEILKKVTLDLKLQNLYLNGEVYQFTLYKDDSLEEELMNIGGFINYDSDEELFNEIFSYVSDKVEDLDFERVYEPAVISKEYVERYINNEAWYNSIMGEDAFYKQKEKSQENNRSAVGFAYDLCANLDKKGIYALPILKYEHGLVKYYIGDSVDRWDGGVVGFAWRDKKELCKEYGVKKLSQKLKTETIEKVVESELKAYTNFANGEVYGFELYSREDGEDVIDSCYGFIGYDSTDDLFKAVLEYIPDRKDFFKVN